MCIICRQEYENYEQLYLVFHTKCTKSWLSTGNHSCPICRRDMFLTCYAPGKESNGVTTTEQTSLLQSANDVDSSVTDPTRDHQIGNFERTYSCF
jgi:hypothetical protein